MKKYRKLEVRKRIDELHNQLHTVEVGQANFALQQHLEGLEKSFSTFPQVNHKKKNPKKSVLS
jgi:hypothetical protein